MTEFDIFLQTLLHTLTFLVLIVGLLGLFIPIFPGLTVMWIATLAFALLQAAGGQMAFIDWFLFGLITLLMLGGNIVDNIIIARHMRDKAIPWSSIILGFAAGIVASLFLTPLVGLVASPLGLLGAEYWRLRDRQAAIDSTKAYMTGFGWSVAARLGIGLVMLVFWMLWAWL